MQHLPKSLWYLGKFAIASGSRIRLEIDQYTFRLERSFLGLLNWKFHRRIEEIDGIELQEDRMLKKTKFYSLSKTFCAIQSKLGDRDMPIGTQTNYFGFFLTQQEKAWLIGEIRAFLEQLSAD